MKPLERDELLIRLDERSKNILVVTENQEQHLRTLNGSIQRQSAKIEENRGDIHVNRSNLVRIWWAYGLIIAMLASCIIKMYLG